MANTMVAKKPNTCGIQKRWVGWEPLVQETERYLPQPHRLCLSDWISSSDWQAQAPPINDRWGKELLIWLANALSKLGQSVSPKRGLWGTKQAENMPQTLSRCPKKHLGLQEG